MAYNTYTVRAWFGEKMVSVDVTAISMESAISDVEQAYGKADFYQVSM